MSEYLPVFQFIAIIILFILFIVDRVTNQQLHNTHMIIIYKHGMCLNEIQVKCALFDMQLGNVGYKTVKGVIEETIIEEERKTVFLNILEDIAVSYNLDRNV